MKTMIHARQIHGVAASREQEYLEGWQRERAELTNFRARVREQESAVRERNLRELAVPLLAVADNFQAVVAHVPAKLADDAWATGVLHVARQLEQVLREYGLRSIEAVGKPFDPHQHEAVEHVSDGKYKSGTVVEVMQPGYLLGDDVVRPAKVKVAE